MPYPIDILTNRPHRIQKRWPFISDAELSDFTNTSVGGTARTAVEDAKGGTFAVTGDNTTDNHGSQLQSNAEIVALASPDAGGGGQEVILRVFFDLDGDKTQSDHIMGWAVTDTSLIVSAPSDGFFLIKDDGDAVWDLVIYKSSSLVKRFTGLFAADLNKHTVVLEARPSSSFDTDGKCKFYVKLDGASVLDDNGGGDQSSNEVAGCPTTELALSFATLNGDGVTTEIMNLHDVVIDIPDLDA